MTRGRMATDPTQIARAGWLDILARIAGRISKDRLGLIAAGVAFFGLLAVFPAITAVLAIGGLVLDPQDIVNQMQNLRGVVPAEVLDIIRDQATSVTTAPRLGLALFVSLGLALWSASRGVNVLCDGLNIVYQEQEKRGFFLHNLQVIGLTFLIILGLVTGLVAIIGVPVLLSYFPLGKIGDFLTRAGTWMLLGAMTVGGLSLLYRFGPSRANARWVWVSPGAILACLGWIGASFAFTLYVQNFANYNESFGALGGVIIMLMWLWISVLVILLGGEVNAEMEHQTRMDTTTGKPVPMGERGAQMADTLGDIRKA